jgi:hypothetical protein
VFVRVISDCVGAQAMDFIERWFGISPDGGDGSLEALYLFAALAVAAVIVFRARIRELIRRHH